MFITESKEKVIDFMKMELKITGLNFVLVGAVMLLAGICVGFLTAPFTHGVCIGSNNGNNRGNNCRNIPEEEEEIES